MSETNAAFGADEPFFHALLMPHRSLGRTGFAVLMGALLFGWAATGAIFLAHGAWPVFGFFGLDVVLLYVAFRVNYRAARVREEVSVSRTSLDIRKTAPSGRRSARRERPDRRFPQSGRPRELRDRVRPRAGYGERAVKTAGQAGIGWRNGACDAILAFKEILP